MIILNALKKPKKIDILIMLSSVLHPAMQDRNIVELGMVKDIDISGQMCVIHCKPGFASAVASQLDESFISGIMGSLAGDDTVLVILREDAKKEKIKSAIKDILSYNE